jgi:hypothetical protein
MKLNKIIRFFFQKNFIAILLLIIISYFLSINHITCASGEDESIPQSILVEIFVNLDCSTCSQAAFCLEDLAWELGSDQMLLLEAHIWDDGLDTPETTKRYNWYVGDKIPGTPDVFINGMAERIQGLPAKDIDAIYEYYFNKIETELNKLCVIELGAYYVKENNQWAIQGFLKNCGEQELKDLIISGIYFLEGEETSQLYLVRKIIDYEKIDLLYPGETHELFYDCQKSRKIDESGLEDCRLVILVQEGKSKNILNSILVQED